MTEEKYNTKDIRHIDEKSQEYIAKGNRMTEEIIIDGVDINKCSNLKAGICSKRICELSVNENCLFKRFKRLEQENKELKEKYTHVLELAKTNADSNEYCLQELEKENKELKEENANLKSLIWYIYCCGEVETIDCIITEYYESRQTQYEKGFWKKVCALKNVPYQSKYKAILEDIREILLEHSCADSHTTKYITDKINEVLNGNTAN